MSGVANMRAGLDRLAKLGAAVKSAPLVVRTAVAKEGAGALSADLREDFEGGRTAYGEPRPASKQGAPLSLVKSGRTKSTLYFAAVGTILRAVLGTKHAKYLVGKYAMLPRGKKLPADWQAKLASIVEKQAKTFEREALR